MDRQMLASVHEFVRNVRSCSSGTNVRLANFSSSFSPGAVLVTFSKSNF